MGNHPLFQVVTHPDQRLAAIAVVEVTNPAFEHGIGFVHHPLKGHDRPTSLGEFGDPIFDLLLGFLRGLDVGVIVSCLSAFSHPGREPKKIKLLRVGIDHYGFCPIQGELQPLQDLLQYGHGLAGFTLPAEDNDIVSISDDTSAQPYLQIVPYPDPV